MRRGFALCVVALAGALIAGACGSDKIPPSVQAGAGTTTIPGQKDAQAMLETITKRGKPTVEVPAAPAITLEIKDVIAGTGDTVKPGATVTVHYVGVSQSTGKQFDASWDRGQPISFPLAQVIKGWTDGIPGMKVGGRRELVIPGDQAYAANPPGGSGIAVNDTLVFVIDLIAVQQ
jgi:peptidylprolyl isomerase